MQPVLTPEELERYARHIVLREVGGPGQAALKRARVLVIGAGGLGAPLLMYLAAAGVGTLGVIDDDAVVAVEPAAPGHPWRRPTSASRRSTSAAAAIARLNPHVAVETHTMRLTRRPTRSTSIARYDLVADGSDNFSTRYLVSDACFLAQRPLVTAAVGTFDGTLTTIRAHERGAGRQAEPDLSLPVSRAAAGRRGPGVPGGRNPRRAHRRGRLHDGAGGDPRDRRLRPGAGRAAADDRRARDALRDAELCVGSGKPAVRRGADDQRTCRGTRDHRASRAGQQRATCSRSRPWRRPSRPTTCSSRY